MLTSPQRSTLPELIDLGHYTSEEYHNCLYQLDRIGRLLGGDLATYWGFKQLKEAPKSILDVGCGGGLFTIRLAQRYPQAHVTGIDISQEAITFAKQQMHKANSPLQNIEFYVPSQSKLNYPAHSFDVITSTLVCHHLQDEELIDFLKNAYRTAKKAVIINDLHRHPCALLSFKTIAPLLFRNRLILHDGPLSIQRAFKKQEWLQYLEKAQIPLEHCSLTWHWAFRWILLINSSNALG